MISDERYNVKFEFFTREFLSVARAREGRGKRNSFSICPAAARQIFLGATQAGGQKGRGLGEGIFARLLSAEGGIGWESVSAIPASTGRQNRKIFVSLIEKILGGRE